MRPLGAYPSMSPPVLPRPRSRLRRARAWLVVALVLVVVCGAVVKAVGRPHRLDTFSDRVATEIGADRSRCPAPQTILRYGNYGGYVYFGAVEWYAAVRWEVDTNADTEQIVNGCLHASPPFSAVDTWRELAPFALRGEWSSERNTFVADDGFGPPPRVGAFVQISEVFGRFDENQRTVYVVRDPESERIRHVDVYMVNVT